MTEKTKTANYDDKAIEFMTATYLPNSSEAERDAQMDQIAESLGKTVASVRSKLSHLAIYVPKVKAATKGKRTTKADLLANISDNANHKNDQFFDSLAGANRDILTWIIGLQTANFDLEAELFDTDCAIVAALEASDAETVENDEKAS